MSKAFTRDDRPEEPVAVRHRPSLPEGIPNYVSDRGLAALRAALAAEQPGARRSALEQRLASSVVPPPPADRDEVRFGAQVRLRAADGQQREVRIVGVDEADPGQGQIAFVAPLARALLGRRVGEQVTVRTPGGADELEILSIAYDP